MREHICFESISCRFLQYVSASKSWVCVKYFDDISHCGICMQCKFARQLEKERQLRKGVVSGRLL